MTAGRLVRVRPTLGVPVLVLFARAGDPPLRDVPPNTDELTAGNSMSPSRWEEFRCGRALLRTAVAEFTGGSPERVRIEATAGGGPVCASHRELGVSVSHSSGRIAVAVAAGAAVGVDVQLPVPVSQSLLSAYGIAGPEPGTGWVDGRRYAFASAWSVRESCVKALGAGIGRGLRSIPVPAGATDGHWGAVHWHRLPDFDGCPAALALCERRPH